MRAVTERETTRFSPTWDGDRAQWVVARDGATWVVPTRPEFGPARVGDSRERAEALVEALERVYAAEAT